MDQGSSKGALKFANYYEYFHIVGEGELVLYYCIQAVLIGESAEAFYRIGDFYYEGRVIERNATMAETLYHRSYDIAKTEGFDLVLARAALRLAESKRGRLMSQSFSLSEQEEVLAYYTEAEPIFSSYVVLVATWQSPFLGLSLTSNVAVKESKKPGR